MKAEILFYPLADKIDVEVPHSRGPLVARLYLDKTLSTPSDYLVKSKVRKLTLEMANTSASFKLSTFGGKGSDSTGAYVNLGSLPTVNQGKAYLIIEADPEFFSKNYKVALTYKRTIDLISGIFAIVFPGLAFLFFILARFL